MGERGAGGSETFQVPTPLPASSQGAGSDCEGTQSLPSVRLSLSLPLHLLPSSLPLHFLLLFLLPSPTASHSCSPFLSLFQELLVQTNKDQGEQFQVLGPMLSPCVAPTPRPPGLERNLISLQCGVL